MTALLALLDRPIGSWGIVEFLILVIIIACCLGVAIIVLRVAGITVPNWVWQIVGIVLAAFVGILAIRFLASM